MAFHSQHSNTRATSRRGSDASIVVSQTYKVSSNTQEFSVRISSDLMDKIGVSMGGKVDILYDSDMDLWMISVVDGSGFTITGKEGAVTGLVRYTLKKGHFRFTEDKNYLPIKKECDDDSLDFSSQGCVIFKLINDEM
ncbi:hypothetical protein KKI95_18660 [Xenorhabdus bovienii]|uniref:hypothetical protein n=1 Tax=Xenorhabdus bovienii TaxID=40576 RepID=UPI00237C55EC|nr:hypothetical protein [Xenorhabdus bovienii]MDE1497078.1 hypothetical protein [Xenorhabdus bovienii]MDE9437890.1 hypothetical protein [Xenorhabdus bovienii]MDE9447477.1 hypothetical protein [Xenorhabdus bovienii]MDE9475021.1 hypothetical protein [Xenorhabdus bovienii]MDE9483907.1 hypothetical protein [Xenorhabdus bovienii]